MSVSGDGGFAQYMGEPTTAVKYGMNIADVPLVNDEPEKISAIDNDGRALVEILTDPELV